MLPIYVKKKEIIIMRVFSSLFNLDHLSTSLGGTNIPDPLFFQSVHLTKLQT